MRYKEKTTRPYRQRPMRPLAERFWEKVDKNGPTEAHMTKVWGTNG